MRAFREKCLIAVLAACSANYHAGEAQASGQIDRFEVRSSSLSRNAQRLDSNQPITVRASLRPRPRSGGFSIRVSLQPSAGAKGTVALCAAPPSAIFRDGFE